MRSYKNQCDDLDKLQTLIWSSNKCLGKIVTRISLTNGCIDIVVTNLDTRKTWFVKLDDTSLSDATADAGYDLDPENLKTLIRNGLRNKKSKFIKLKFSMHQNMKDLMVKISWIVKHNQKLNSLAVPEELEFNFMMQYFDRKN